MTGITRAERIVLGALILGIFGALPLVPVFLHKSEEKKEVVSSVTPSVEQRSKIEVRTDMCMSERCRDFAADLQRRFEQLPQKCFSRDNNFGLGAPVGICSHFGIFIGETRGVDFDFDAIIIEESEGARPRLVKIYAHPDHAFRKLREAIMEGLR